MHDAVLVSRFRAGRPARAFRKDDDLAIARELPPRTHAFMSASACEPLLRSTGIMPAFQAYQPKNGIHISSRFMM